MKAEGGAPFTTVNDGNGGMPVTGRWDRQVGGQVSGVLASGPWESV